MHDSQALDLLNASPLQPQIKNQLEAMLVRGNVAAFYAAFDNALCEDLKHREHRLANLNKQAKQEEDALFDAYKNGSVKLELRLAADLAGIKDYNVQRRIWHDYYRSMDILRTQYAGSLRTSLHQLLLHT